MDLGGVGHVLEEHDGEMAVGEGLRRGMAGRWGGRGSAGQTHARGRAAVGFLFGGVPDAWPGAHLELQRQGFGHGDGA